MTEQRQREIIEELKVGVELLQAAERFDEKTGSHICSGLQASFVLAGGACLCDISGHGHHGTIVGFNKKDS